MAATIAKVSHVLEKNQLIAFGATDIAREVLYVTADATTAVIDCSAGGKTELVRNVGSVMVMPANATAGTILGTVAESVATIPVPYAVISTVKTPNDTVTITNTISGGTYFVSLVGRQ